MNEVGKPSWNLANQLLDGQWHHDPGIADTRMEGVRHMVLVPGQAVFVLDRPFCGDCLKCFVTPGARLPPRLTDRRFGRDAFMDDHFLEEMISAQVVAYPLDEARNPFVDQSLQGPKELLHKFADRGVQ